MNTDESIDLLDKAIPLSKDERLQLFRLLGRAMAEGVTRASDDVVRLVVEAQAAGGGVFAIACLSAAPSIKIVLDHAAFPDPLEVAEMRLIELPTQEAVH